MFAILQIINQTHNDFETFIEKLWIKSWQN